MAANPRIGLEITSDKSSIKQSLNLPDKYLLYVGDINYNKNIPGLLKSLADIPSDIKLVCVGKNFKEQEFEI